MKTIVVNLFFYFFFISHISSQQSDSLKKELLQLPDDTNKVLVLNTLAKLYEGIYPATSKKYFTQAIKLANKINFPTGLARGYINKGNFNFRKGDYEQALEAYSFSLKISEEANNYAGISSAYSGIGLVYTYQGDYAKAIQTYFKALKVKEALDDKEGQAAILSNVGLLYMNQNKFKEAISYHKRSLEIEKSINNKKGVAESYNNIAFVYHNQQKFNQAKKYYSLSYKLSEDVGDKQNMAICLNNIGSIYESQNKHKLALTAYHSSMKIKENLGDKHGLVQSFVSISSLLIKQKNYNQAFQYLFKAKKLANELNSKSVMKQIYDIETDLYEAKRDFQKALISHRLFVSLKDSILNEESNKLIAELDAKYQDEKKTKELIMSKKENELKKVELSKQTAIKNSFLLGFLIVLVAAIFSYRAYQAKHKINIELAKSQTEIQQKNLKLAQYNKEILDSITYAKRIQSAILPQAKLVKEFLVDSFILYKPKDIVAGDFYWLEVVGDTVLFAAADCTGHGVPGAMVSVVCNNALNRSVREFGLTKPNEILDKTRELVIQEFEKSDEDVKDGMDISLVALRFREEKPNENEENPTRSTLIPTLYWSGANNPLWILRKNLNGEVEVLETKPDKQPIGKHAISNPFTSHQINVYKEDIIYIFTDGFQDQFGEKTQKKFRISKFKELLVSISTKSMEEQRKLIDASFEDWKGNLEQVDDVCVIGVRL